jgi:hypothetical protein
MPYALDGVREVQADAWYPVYLPKLRVALDEGTTM